MEDKPKTDVHALFAAAIEEKRFMKLCAPMVRYSKLEFRNLVRSYDTDLTFTSMIMADSFCQSDKARAVEFTTNKDDTPVVAQFAAKTSIDLLSAAEMVYPYVDGVDLNCGCPQRWAMADGYGSALLKTPDMIADMLSTVRRNLPSTFSVSVKVRLLQKPMKDTIDMCRKLEATGISFLTVHGRTPAQDSKVPANWQAIKEIKQSLTVPVVANGDIFTLQDAEDVHALTECDGVMAARGILSNPALYAGYKRVPVECVQRWLDITKEADEDINFPTMHHHFSFMSGIMPKSQRVVLNNLAKPKERVYDFYRDTLQMEPRPIDYPKKWPCTFDERKYRERRRQQGMTGDSTANGYDSEATEGAFFRSNREAVEQEEDEADFMESSLFDENGF